MAIGQQPTDLTNTHRETDRVSATPAAGTSPKKGGPTTPPEGQHTPKHRLYRSVSRRETRHREVHAERKECAKARKNVCQRNHGTGHASHRPQRTPSKGAPLQWLDFAECKSPSERASDASDPGATQKGPPDGSGPQIRIAPG
jgi:hypothetical protein